MADYRTEEEQIELLKNWWKESGTSTMAGVALALAAWLGWIGWQNHQATRVEAAAALYQDVTGDTDAGMVADPVKQKSVADILRASYPDTVYAIFAGLQVASLSVESNDFQSASDWLVWARSQAQEIDPDLATLTAYRLARVQYAKSDYEGALGTIDSIKEPGAFNAALLELRGDVLLAQGKRDAAVQIYSDAIKAIEESGSPERRQDLEMKMGDLSAHKIINNAAIVTGDGT